MLGFKMNDRIPQIDADAATLGEWNAIHQVTTRLGIPLEPHIDREYIGKH